MEHFCLFVSEMSATKNDQDVSVKSEHPPEIHIHNIERRLK